MNRVSQIAVVALLSFATNAHCQSPAGVPPAPGRSVPVFPADVAPSPAPQAGTSAGSPSSIAAAAAASAAADTTAGAKPVIDLLASLARFDQNGRDPSQKIGFELPERAVNDYVAYVLRTRPRPGLKGLRVTLQAHNQIVFEPEVDFATIAPWFSGAVPDALKAFLGGGQSVRLTVDFESRDGAVTLKWKDAVLPGSKAISASVFAAFLQTLGSRQPEAFDITKPIPLPFGLKRIWTEKQTLGGET
jgi:hypothetical protein